VWRGNSVKGGSRRVYRIAYFVELSLIEFFCQIELNWIELDFKLKFNGFYQLIQTQIQLIQNSINRWNWLNFMKFNSAIQPTWVQSNPIQSNLI
jgi:hypothetical protein